MDQRRAAIRTADPLKHFRTIIFANAAHGLFLKLPLEARFLSNKFFGDRGAMDKAKS